MLQTPSKNKIEVCFSPHDFDLFKDDFELIVVIDALRATSAICAAFQNGIKSLIPVSTIDEAKDYQAKGYLVGAEREGKIVDGFDFGNSPFSYKKPSLKDQTVVLSTTNGTKSIKVAQENSNATIVIGSFLNLDHLSTWLAEQGKDVLCLCSGWKDKFNLEDTICAGAITSQLLETGKFESEEDSSVAAKYLFLSAKDNIFGYLKSSSHRKRLKNLNLNRDVVYCLTPNTTNVIPILKGNKLVEINDY